MITKAEWGKEFEKELWGVVSKMDIIYDKNSPSHTKVTWDWQPLRDWVKKLLEARTATIIEKLSAKKQPVTYKKDNGHGWAVPMVEVLKI